MNETNVNANLLAAARGAIVKADAERDRHQTMRDFTPQESIASVAAVRAAYEKAGRLSIAAIRTLPESATAGVDHLPPAAYVAEHKPGEYTAYYTADQMRAYAATATSAARREGDALVEGCKRLIDYAERLDANARADGYGGGNTFAKQVFAELREPLAALQADASGEP